MCNDGAGFFNRDLEIYDDRIEHLLATDWLKRSPADIHPRVGEQVVYERFHSFRAIQGKTNEFFRLLIEFSSGALLQQLQETGDHPQRLKQIMRCDVGELLQISVRPGQVRAGVAKSKLRSPPFNELANLTAYARKHFQQRLVWVLNRWTEELEHTENL